jgi:hypothetical protein
MAATRPPRLMGILYGASIVYVLICAIGIIVQVVGIVIACQPGAHLMVTLPAQQDYPSRSGTLTYGGSAYVVPGTSVSFTEATMEVTGLPASMVIWLRIGPVISAVTGGSIALLIGLLAHKIRAGQPFASNTSRTLLRAAVFVAVGFTFSSLISQASRNAVAHSIAYIPRDGFLQLGGSSFELDLVPLYFALVLVGLAAIFRTGERLQRDTDGLV